MFSIPTQMAIPDHLSLQNKNSEATFLGLSEAQASHLPGSWIQSIWVDTCHHCVLHTLLHCHEESPWPGSHLALKDSGGCNPSWSSHHSSQSCWVTLPCALEVYCWMSGFQHCDPEWAEGRVFGISCKSPRPGHLRKKEKKRLAFWRKQWNENPYVWLMEWRSGACAEDSF